MPKSTLLPTPEAGEDPHPLPLAAGEQAVDRADAGGQRLADSRPRARMGRQPSEGNPIVQRRPRPAVHRVAGRVDHPAEQPLADAQPMAGPRQPHAVAVADAGQIAEGIQQRQLVAETDHLGQQRGAGLALDLGHRPDGRRKTGRRNGHADRPRDRPGQGGWNQGVELFGEIRHRDRSAQAQSPPLNIQGFSNPSTVRSVSSSSIRSNWASNCWSIVPKRVSTRQPPRDTASSAMISAAPRPDIS